MRFTIDLLQGRGMPQKSRPGTMALAVVPFLIPMLTSGLLAAHWIHNRTLIQTEQAVLRQNQQNITRNAEDLRQYETLQKKILDARHNIKNINDALGFEMTASPLLMELVQALPSGVFLNKLELEYQPIRRKFTNPQNNMAEYKQVIQRSLRLVVAGPSQIESDQAVDAYIQALRTCPALGTAAKEIQITSRQESELDGKTMVLYEIKCPFIEQQSKR